MNRIKLTEAGSAAIRHIERVDVNTAGKWPDYELVSGSDIIVIPKSAADRQLARLNLKDADGLVGGWVKVSRSDEPGDNGKLFWNLTIVPAPKDAPSPRVESPYRAPSGGAKKQPFDEPTDAEARMAKMDKAMESRETDGDDGFEAFSAAVDAVERPAKGGAEAQYMALFERVAKEQARIGAEYQMPFDASSVNATTFSIAKKLGIV